MLKYCLFCALVLLSFPANAASETCSYFAKEIQISFETYLRTKNSNNNGNTSFNIVGAGSDSLQILDNQIQIYRNLGCDVKTLQLDMDKIHNSASKRS